MIKWLKHLWNSVWQYLIKKDREQVMKQMIRDQTKSEPSKHRCPRTGLTIVDKLPVRRLKIKKKRKANE